MAREQPHPLTLGIDLGTSGARAMLVDARRRVLAQAAQSLPASQQHEGLLCQDPDDWWSAVAACVRDCGRQVPLSEVGAIAVAGTSGTLLLVDKNGVPITRGIMYNDQRPAAIARDILALSGPCAAASVSSGLAKLVWLQRNGRTQGARFALHAADWISGRLSGQYGDSDEHNALKTGFDPVTRRWPQWLAQLGIEPALLPKVHEPGEVVAAIDPDMARQFGFAPSTKIRSGTTDSVASFLATGAHEQGDAVTVLGSTLVVKVLSNAPVVAPEYGVYSHRVGRLWLVGGASNSGGGALARYLSLAEIQTLSSRLDPSKSSTLDYYPLPATGERFPIADPGMTSRVTPIPDDRLSLLHGLLEGIARIEKSAYTLLAELGATPARRIYSAGSGADNPAWQAIRQRVLGIEFAKAENTQAAYGAARLAAMGSDTISTNGV